MNKKPHYIKSQVFEVSFFDAPESFNFQKDFSDFVRSQVAEITEKCLKEFDGPSLRIINRLELNLEDISYHNYEVKFARLYEQELMKQLTNKLIHQGADHVEEANSSESLLKMVRHFLLKGYMPWNYNNEKWSSFSELFDHLLDSDENTTLLEMNDLLRSDINRTRLINQLEERSIVKLVRSVEPSQGDFIVSYHQQWVVGQKKKPTFSDQEKTLSKTFWIFIFNYLFEDRGTLFNTKAFLISTLHQIANKYNRTYQQVLVLLRDSYSDLTAVVDSQLYGIIKMITEEEITKPEEVIQEEVNQYGSIDDIRFYAINGKWPSDGRLRKPYKDILNYLIDTQKRGMLSLLKSLANDFKSIDQIIEPLNNKECTLIIRKLEIANADTIESYHQIIIDSSSSRPSLKLSSEAFSKIVWVFILTTLLSEFSSYFNHKSFLISLFKRIANHYNVALKTLLQELRNGLAKIDDASKEAELLRMVLGVINIELGEEPKKIELTLSSIDSSLLEESAISGVLHPFLKEYGFLSVNEAFIYFNEKEPLQLHDFIKKGWSKTRFRTQLLKDHNLLSTIFSIPSFREWGKAIETVTSSDFPSRFQIADYRKGVLSLIISSAYNLDWQQKSFEKELIAIANRHGIDFNELIKSLLWLKSEVSITALDHLISGVANKLSIADEQRGRKVESGKENENLTLLFELVRQGIQGIVNQGKLLTLGFKSIDELLRHLIKNEKQQLKYAFVNLEKSGQPLMGIGREIPLSTFYSLLIAINEVHGSQLARLLRSLEIELDGGSQSIKRFLSTVRTLVLSEISQNFNLESFLKAFSKILLEGSPTVYLQVVPVLTKKISTISIPVNSNVSEFINRLEEQLLSPETHNSPMDIKGLQEIIKTEFFEETIANEESTIIPYFDETKPVVYDEIYIENAGLVLLSSYFPHLFEKFSLTEEGVFLSEEKRETAVLLLQYLMMEIPPLNEHHLPLNKVLCGLEVDVPIRTDLQLGKRDKKIVDGLIEAVISYWSAIGDSSISGFQGSWLWRKGKLEHKEESWELKVEQHSYDMLLERFPFTMTPVKFSWMNKPLIVEWR